MSAIHPFDDLINFIANMAPEQVLAFRASDSTVKRVKKLLEKEKRGNISPEEKIELERFLLQEDLMVIAKVRASIQLGQQ